jgi:hypothetical protein
MTPLEKWLLDNVFQIGILLIGGIFAFLKLQNFQTGMKDRVKKDEELLSKHLTDANPHADCPVHGESLISIKKSIDEVKQHIITLDERIFTVIRNSAKHDPE